MGDVDSFLSKQRLICAQMACLAEQYNANVRAFASCTTDRRDFWEGLTQVYDMYYGVHVRVNGELGRAMLEWKETQAGACVCAKKTE